MNNEDTIRAITPIINSRFRGEIDAELALDWVGRILKENHTANPEPKQ